MRSVLNEPGRELLVRLYQDTRVRSDLQLVEPPPGKFVVIARCGGTTSAAPICPTAAHERHHTGGDVRPPRVAKPVGSISN